MDGGAWWVPVHGVAKSRAQLSDFTCTFHFHALEKEMYFLMLSGLDRILSSELGSSANKDP